MSATAITKNKNNPAITHKLIGLRLQSKKGGVPKVCTPPKY
jgi:hypothetical protein